MRRFEFIAVLNGTAPEHADALRGLVEGQPDAGVRDDVGVAGDEVATLPARLVARYLERMLGCCLRSLHFLSWRSNGFVDV
jgi:hypothetical protein